MELNTNVQEMITSFAKMNKISKAKVTDLVTQIVQQTSSKGPRGRKVTEGVRHIQEGVLQMHNFTVLDVANKFGITKVVAKRVIRRNEKSGKLLRVGKDVSEGSARKVICWSAI